MVLYSGYNSIYLVYSGYNSISLQLVMLNIFSCLCFFEYIYLEFPVQTLCPLFYYVVLFLTDLWIIAILYS